jgi:hypothetical protein
MGVSYNPCGSCGETFSDCGEYLECSDCNYAVGSCCMPDGVDKWTGKNCPRCRGLVVDTETSLLPFLAKRAGYRTVKEARRALQRSERKKYLLRKQEWLAKRKARVAKRAAERAACKKEYGSETIEGMTEEMWKKFDQACEEGKHKEWEFVGMKEEETTDEDEKDYDDGPMASDPEVELKTLAEEDDEEEKAKAKAKAEAEAKVRAEAEAKARAEFEAEAENELRVRVRLENMYGGAL